MCASKRENMARKPAQQQADTLQIIRQRAFSLFSRFGFEGVSIGDIASACHLSKGALYWHFRGKEALYLDCLQQLHALFDAHVFAPMRVEPDPEHAVLLLFHGLRQMMYDPRIADGITGFWLTPATSETQQIVATQRDFEAQARQVIEQTLRRGVEAGRFDLGSDLEDFSRAVIALAETCLLPLRHQPPEEIERILAVLARTLFRAYGRGTRAA